MIERVGFIGSGNITAAIISGIINSGFLKPQNINVSSLHKNSAASLAANYGVKLMGDNIELVKNSDAVVLSVKPNTYAGVIKKIKNHIKDGTLIVTVAAGITIDFVKAHFERDVKVVRTMPNTLQW